MSDSTITESPKGDRPHVLVVDDETRARESFGAMLEDEDYEVSLACSGDKAIEILNRQTVNILCTDFQMPGMNGIELMQKAESISPATVAVLVTGFPDFDADWTLGKKSRHMLLLKPFNPDEVFRVLGQAARFSRIRGLLNTLPDRSEAIPS